MNKYPIIIKLNKYFIKFSIIVPIVFLELVVWLIFFLSDYENNFALFVYIFSPLLVVFGIVLYFIVCKIYKTRLECFPDKIVIEKRKSSTIFLVKDTLKISYVKSGWDCEVYDFIPFFYRTGNSIIIEDIEQNEYRFYANISYKDFCILADMYPNNVDEQYRAYDIEKEIK